MKSVATHSGGSLAKKAPWSHQTELRNMVGKDIWIKINEGGIGKLREGVLLNADQYTLSLSSGRGSVTYFKHAIVSYGLTE